ncbi:MAG: alpha/beta fold hydrolase [Alphaproteobacteria bacterium]
MTEYRELRFSAQDGLALYCREYGERASRRVPVVCLTGLTRNSKDFHALASRLGRDRRVLCPDYRGRGRSQYDVDWRNYQPRAYLDDLRHLTTLAQVPRAVFIGTSMGGLLSAAMAIMSPTSVAGIVMNDCGPDLDPSGLARIFAYIGCDRVQRNWLEAAEELRAMFPDLPLNGDEAWLDMARSTFREGEDGRLHFDWDVNLARPLVSGMASIPDLWVIFQGLAKIPTVAVRGARSDVLSTATFARMAATNRDLAAVVVPGVGHAPSLSEPAARAAIDALLAGLDP